MDAAPLRLAVTAWLFAVTASAGVLGDQVRAEAAGITQKRWDRRVAELADFVENRRGLDFKHPVSVHFLNEGQFAKEATTHRGDLSRPERQDLDELVGTLRALGLSRSRASRLLEQFNESSAAGILAFYDPANEEVVVRGKQLDIATKVTVIHELTHVAQDQSFDLDKLLKKARGGGEFALAALVEGDAMRIEAEYVRTLSQSDQQRYVDEATKLAEEIGAGGYAPEILRVVGGAPYALGPAFVHAIQSARGEKAIDAAFRKLPQSDEHILTPSTYLSADTPTPVEPPDLVAGEKRVGKPKTFGALGLFATLAWRLPAEVALDAAFGWGGDSLVLFDRDGRDCLRVTFAGDTPSDTDAIATAFGQWISFYPSHATIEQEAGTATLTSCKPDGGVWDPLPSVREAEARLRDSAGVLAARGGFLLSQIGSATIEEAQCVADTLAIDPSMRTVFESGNPPDEAQAAKLSETVDNARRACGVDE